MLRKESKSVPHPILDRFVSTLIGKKQKRDLFSSKRCMSSHLEVKRAVHAVLLRPEDARQVFRHDDDDDDDERRIFWGGKCGQNLDLKKGRKNTRVKRKHA